MFYKEFAISNNFCFCSITWRETKIDFVPHLMAHLVGICFPNSHEVHLWTEVEAEVVGARGIYLVMFYRKEGKSTNIPPIFKSKSEK